MAGWGPLSSLSPVRRAVLVGAAVAVVAATVAVVITASGDDQQAVQTEDGTTSTTEEVTTTSIESTTTTQATTTTEASTTTAPPTTAPPPPTTAAPPPPATTGSLDMGKVLATAKGGSGGTAPQTYTGANVCPAYVARPSDAGDDNVRDITDWYLSRYCDGVYRGVLSTSSDTPALQAAWMRFDTKSGGCQGTDFVVIGWHTTGGGGRGAVVATPGCDQGSWHWVESAGFPVYDGAWLQLDFRGSAIGNPGAFDWRGYVQGVGETGGAIDVVPNAGPERFVV